MQTHDREDRRLCLDMRCFCNSFVFSLGRLDGCALRSHQQHEGRVDEVAHIYHDGCAAAAKNIYPEFHNLSSLLYYRLI